MKLWIDDVRPAPDGYWWCRSVNEAKRIITDPHIQYCHEIKLIDMDHDAGDYAQYGGDYIKLLDWLEETGRNYPIRIHSMNPVGIENMRVIIQRNGWKEVIY
jgi:hypothetical protein